MKFLGYLAGIIVGLVVILYVVAFTPFGNALVAPVIESKIQQQTKMQSKLDTFVLSMSHFEILLHINKDNAISLKGKYSLFSQTFDIDYKVAMANLATLEPLTKQPLRGDFFTNGNLKGDMDFITINGDSNFAKSDTKYHVELTKFNPTSIIAHIKDMKLQKVLYTVSQSQYAKADVDIDINFKNITIHKLDGDIKLITKKGMLDSALMKRDFNITLPQTAFSMNLDAKLKKDDLTYSYLLNSNLAKITTSGDIVTSPLKTDIKYGVDIKELLVLKPLSKVDIKGTMKLNGTLKGTKDNMINKLYMSGDLDNRYLTKVYKFESLMPKFHYALSMLNKIKTTHIDTAMKLRTSLANLDVKKATLKLSDNSFVSDYTTQVPSLEKLYFITQRHMRGGIVANGEIKKAKDLDFSAHSNIAGGKLDAKLHNDDFHADINSMQTLDILHILIYPEIFKSTLDAKIDYNIVAQKGKAKGYLNNGLFTKNQVFTLVKQYTKLNMYKERFKGDVDADINKENIIASLNLTSNTSSIKTKNTHLNTKTNKIKSNIDIVANNNPIGVRLKGDVNAPDVKIDANELIKKEATKAIQKEAGKFLKGLF